jgi:hypothetical protein
VSKLNAGRVVKAIANRSLWLIVLVPILAVSGYSLFYVARYLGVPPPFAVVMSTCFDGTALIAAEYSLRYAQVGLSGSGPRAVVRIFALIAAWLQTLHARIGHEPPGAWALWAALPIAAVVVYDIHIRWERRRALANAGVIYPAPLPAFGLSTWVLFPFASLGGLRGIVERRKNAIIANAERRLPVTIQGEIVKEPVKERVVKEPAKDEAREPAEPRPRPLRVAGTPHPHTPTKHIREWWASTGRQPILGDRGKVPAFIIEEYEQLAVGNDG